jgi:hypothetical protein
MEFFKILGRHSQNILLNETSFTVSFFVESFENTLQADESTKIVEKI